MSNKQRLGQILEQAHPDPYIRGGGRVAFHRRLYDAMASVPPDGMTREAFHELLLPIAGS